MQGLGPTPSKHVRRRKVADLNEEQKQRKRDMDRQAQQAFRERTKAQIQGLEAEVEMLRRQASEKEDIWRQENARLRKQVQRLFQRLRQISDLAGSHAEPMLDSALGRALSDPTPQLAEPTTRATSPGSFIDTASDNAATESQAADRVMSDVTAHEGGQRLNNENHQVSHLLTAGQQPTSNPLIVDQQNQLILGMGIERSDSQNVIPQTNQDIELPDHTSHVVATYETMCAGSVPLGFLPPTPLSTQGLASHVAASITNQRRQYYETTCDHSHRTCPFDHILVNLLESKRLDIAKGEPTISVIGPLQPDIAGMFQPEKAARSHQLSRTLVEMMLTFTHVNLLERVAFMYKIHKTMRWHIAPSKETYDVLPTWLRPTTKQILTPHAAWIDNIPWPAVRDMLVEFPDKYPFEEFSEVYSSNVTISWPYNESDIVVDLSGMQDSAHATQAVINPIFERHIRNLDNWTVSEAFGHYYPEMRAAVSSRY